MFKYKAVKARSRRCHGHFHWLVMIMLCYRVFDWSHTKKRASEQKKSSVKFEIRIVHHRGRNLDFQMKNVCVNY